MKTLYPLTLCVITAFWFVDCQSQIPILWGLNKYAGTVDMDSRGTLFSINGNCTGYTSHVIFKTTKLGKNITHEPILAGNGLLYGLSRGQISLADKYNGGLYSYNPLNGNYTFLHAFHDATGSVPYGKLMQAGNGKLYGTTTLGPSGLRGVLFSFDPVNDQYVVECNFDSLQAQVYGGLMQAQNGKLYGVTYSGNAFVYSYDPVSRICKKLFQFPAAGTKPYGHLIELNNGRLCGISSVGGSFNDGIIFIFDTLNNTATTVYSFDSLNGKSPGDALLLASNGLLYGETFEGGSKNLGVLYSFDPDSLEYKKLFDFNDTLGAWCNGQLLEALPGKLYGKARSGGTYSAGTLFRYTISDSGFAVLHNFNGYDGYEAFGGLTKINDSTIVGTTFGGGDGFNNGVLFRFNLYTDSFEKLFNFNEASTSQPLGGLVYANNGKFYGLSSAGGKGYGDIFEYDPLSDTCKSLFQFFPGTGASPQRCRLLQTSSGMLYGMTWRGDSATFYNGLLFKFNPASRVYTKLYEFDGVNGAEPKASLIEASDGKLYGMTSTGGNQTFGVLFSFDTLTCVLTKLHDFDTTFGAGPGGSLLQAHDGKLYGLTSIGGNYNQGVLFSYNIQTNQYAMEFEFSNSTGQNPNGTLIEATNGKLYGTCMYGGQYNKGTIFSYDVLSNAFQENSFFGDGANPDGSLLQASDGKIYGSLPWLKSQLFSFDPVSRGIDIIKDMDSLSGFHPGDLIQVGVINNIAQMAASSFSLAPIPCRDQLTLTSETGLPADAMVRVTDMEGKIYAVPCSVINNTASLNLKNLAAGNYILTLRTGKIEVSKIFVRQ